MSERLEADDPDATADAAAAPPLHVRNLLAHGLDPAKATPYASPSEHLRDEIWRIWLRVEYEIRRRWEVGSLPPAQDGARGQWKPREIAGLFRAAHSEYTGTDDGGTDHGARVALDAYLCHSALTESRVERTLATDVELPLIDLARRFGLDARQRMSLAITLAPEADPNLLTAFRYLTNDPTVRHVDGRLLSILVYDSLVARSRLARDLSPRSPLVFYRLIEQDEAVGRHDSVLYRRLRPAARLVPLLAGGDAELDPELESFAEAPEHGEPGLFAPPLVDLVARALAGDRVLVVLQGQRGIGKRTLLGTAAQETGRRLLLVHAAALASRPAATALPVLHSLLREAVLLDAIPTVPDLDDLVTAGPQGQETPPFLASLCSLWDGPIAVTLHGDRLPPLRMRPVVHLTLPLPDLGQRAALWHRHVADLPAADGEELAERFAVPGGTIAMASRAAAATSEAGVPRLDELDLAVRNQLYGRLQRLGTPLDTPYSFDDLVADEDTILALREIVAAIQERRRVREEWGFRGAPGISVLFSGHPGVGKTMSAGVVARALGLSIYEIDLSQVVSKWIGETEKNLAEVFDAAEPGHVVLLFNEADSLFGRRTVDVKSANDRHANLETNYLLQRLERFGGLSILTTNLTKAVDPAFRRRFAYDVQFPFPTVELRTELWRRAIPKRASTRGLDPEELADRFELSGGYIKVAAERAAFNAAARSSPITMPILVETIERMYRERGKLSPVGKLE